MKEGEETETLPDRPVSGHPNDVTREGLEQIELALQLAPKAYAAAQEAYDRATLAMASRDLRYWTARRGSAVVIPDPSENSLIRFGHTVTIIREDDRRQTFRIVGEDEADPKRGTISQVAPRARARFGKGLGTQQGIIQARDCRSLFENVCVGSISDLCARRGDVCFTPDDRRH